MSIKQNGGVFGRNPTFNDVTIEGDLIINGEVFTGLDFQGSWNASTNSPTLASSVGTNGEFYIVSIAGGTNLNGITNWGIGDWAIFNGTAWQRVEGGADGNFNDVTVAGTLGVTGEITANGGIALGDDDKAVFGAGSDLEIYHTATGNHSIIEETGGGNLVVRTNGSHIEFDKGSTEYMARMIPDGAVELYYDSALKLATTSTGIDVTGTAKIVRGSSGATRSDNAQELVLEHPFNVGMSILGADGRIAFGDSADNDAGLIRYTHSNDNMLFSTGGATALSIDSSQNVGIGTSSPTSPLHIKSATNVNVRFDDSGSSSYTWYMNDAQNLYIPNVQLASTHTFYANGQRKVDIDASGHAIIPEGVTLGTAAGVYSAANTLDDYEEGVFTPVLADAASGGNEASLSYESGTYVKIGRFVNVTISVLNIDTTGMTAGNNLYLRGLPYNSFSSNESDGVVRSNSVAFTNYITALMGENRSFLYFMDNKNGLSASIIKVSDLTSGVSDISMTLTYQAA